MVKTVAICGFLILCNTAVCQTQYATTLDECINSKLSQDQKTNRLIALAEDSEKQGCQDSVGWIWHRISVMYYPDNLPGAVRYGLIADSVRTGLQDTGALIQTKFNLAFFYSRLGKLRLCAEKHREIIDLGRGHNDTMLILSYIWYADNLTTRGDYPRAIEVAKSGIRLARDLGKYYEEGQANFSLATAIDLSTVPSDTSAFQFFIIAENLYRQEEKFDVLQECLFNHANSLRKHGFPKLAVEKYLEILNWGQNYRITSKMEVDVYNNLALAYRDADKLKLAIPSINKARMLVQLLGTENLVSRALTADNFASILEAQGRFEEALVQYQLALRTLLEFKSQEVHENPGIQNILRSEFQVDLLNYLTDKANCLKNYATSSGISEYFHWAKETYKVCDQLLDHMRSTQPSTETQLFWREKARDMYDNAISVSLAYGPIEDVQHFIDKSRGMLVIDALRHFEAQNQIERTRITIGDSLNNQLREVNMLHFLSSDKDEQLSLESRRNLIQIAIADFIASMKRDFPRYAEIKFQKQPPSIDEIRREIIGNDKMLVSYTLIDEEIIVLVISDHDIYGISLKPENEWQDQIKELIEMVSGRVLNVSRFCELAHKAYQLLIAPLGSLDSDLIIIPDGILANLPFDLLLTQEWTDKRLRNAPYLIRKHKITYGLSAQHLVQVKAIDVPGKYLQSFAPTFLESSALKQLPRNREEVSHIHKYFKGDPFIGESAYRAVFKDSAGKYKSYHFATHAVLNQENSDYTTLEFSDGPVYMSEIYTTPLHAEMVVLSACETASGEYKSGEGVMSLARAFTTAGAKSVIPTLWSINDRSAQEIMGMFYKNLARGLDKSTALHKAKLSFLNDPKKKNDEVGPYHWAAFVSYGDMSPVTLERRRNSPVLWICAVVLLILAGFGLYYKPWNVKAV